MNPLLYSTIEDFFCKNPSIYDSLFWDSYDNGKNIQDASFALAVYWKTSSYEQRCGFSMQYSFQYVFHFIDDIFFHWIVPLIFNWFHLILQQILQFLQCGYSHMDGQMDRQMDRIIDRQTKWWADRPMNGWTCNECA